MNLAPFLKQRFFDSNGSPLSGGKLHSYQAGTTTPQATYSDSSGTANTNPVVLDSSGYADVWLDPSLAYKFVLADSGDVTQWTVDNVFFSNGISAWNANSTYQTGDIVIDLSGQGLLYVSLVDSNTNNALTDASSWRSYDGHVRTLSSDTTLVVTDNIVRSNSTSAGLTMTLPACSTTPTGKRITIKDVGTGGNATTIKGSGTDTVDGNVTYATTFNENDSATFINNGTSWDVVGDVAVGSITQNKLASKSTGSTVSAGGFAISSSSGSFSTTSTTSVAVTNLSVTITTTGRPVFIGTISDGAGIGYFGTTDGTGWNAGVFQGTNQLSLLVSEGEVIPGSVWHIDTPSAGTYTYSIQVNTVTATMHAQFLKLIAYEI